MDKDETKIERDIRTTNRLLDNFEKLNAEFDQMNAILQEILEEKIDLETIGINPLSERLERLDSLRMSYYDLFDRSANAYEYSNRGGNSRDVKQMSRSELGSLISKLEVFNEKRRAKYDELLEAAIERGKLLGPVKDCLKSVNEEIEHYDQIIREVEESIEKEKEILNTELTDIARKYHLSLLDAHQAYLNDLRNIKMPLEAERDKYLAEIEILTNGGMPNFTLVDGFLVEKNKITEKESQKAEEEVNPKEQKKEAEESNDPNLEDPIKEEAITPAAMPSETPDLIKDMDKDMSDSTTELAGRPEDMEEEKNNTEDKKPESKTDDKEEEEEEETADEEVVRGKVVKAELAKNGLVRAITFIIAAVAAFLAGLGVGKYKKAAEEKKAIETLAKASDPNLTVETATQLLEEEEAKSSEETEEKEEKEEEEEKTSSESKSDTGASSSSSHDNEPIKTPLPSPTQTPAPTEGQKEVVHLRPGEVSVGTKTNENGTKTVVYKDYEGNTVTEIIDASGEVISRSIEPDKDSKRTSINGKEYNETTVPNVGQKAENKPTGGISIEEAQKTFDDDLMANAMRALLGEDPDASEVYDGPSR